MQIVQTARLSCEFAAHFLHGQKPEMAFLWCSGFRIEHEVNLRSDVREGGLNNSPFVLADDANEKCPVSDGREVVPEILLSMDLLDPLEVPVFIAANVHGFFGRIGCVDDVGAALRVPAAGVVFLPMYLTICWKASPTVVSTLARIRAMFGFVIFGPAILLVASHGRGCGAHQADDHLL